LEKLICILHLTWRNILSTNVQKKIFLYPTCNYRIFCIIFQKTFLEKGQKAFLEDFEAWQIGPVIPSIYYQYCGFGGMPIAMKYEIQIKEEDMKIIDPIICKKRTIKFWDVVKDIQNPQKAWAAIYNNGSGNHPIIPKLLIKNKG